LTWPGRAHSVRPVPFAGEIRSFAFGQVPTGWLPCDGRLLQINTNQELYALLGTTFGGDGQATFALPDLRGRAALGAGGAFPFGRPGGEESHTLTPAELPGHSHRVRASPLPGTTPSPAGARLAAQAMYAPPNDLGPLGSGSVGLVGGSQPHTNMQPFLTVNVCICAAGVWPNPGSG
jgi:microcystin-dependent protein